MSEDQRERLRQRVVDKFGSQAEFARAMRVSRQAVHAWIAEGVPAARVPSVSRALGVPMKELHEAF
ncbi:MAG: YdaS family helix-turn-helix protein [Gammaproteobacteria bacterium]